MILPRNIDFNDLIKSVKKFEYHITRQTGSHIRLTTSLNGEHHITIPRHSPLRIGTLSSIINSISIHFNCSKEQIIEKLFY